jgi:TetR/AcrR family transcriptional regulator, transcriptional repressor for nem operon
MARPKAFDEEAVVDKAVDLFWCRGYEATSMQLLVEGLGINRASLYDTYGDKYRLYVRALERYRQTHQGGLCQLLEQPHPAPDLLTDLFDNTVREALGDPDHKGCFMVNAAIELAPHDPAVSQIVADNQRAFEQRIQAVVERGQADGTLTARHSAADLARFIFNTINGIKVLSKAGPDETALRSIVAVTMSALVA